METLSHILVVDDDREIRTLLAEYLDTNGFRTSTATNGADMHKVLAESRVDLIVLDLTLPGEDGLTLCRNLRAQSTLSNIPVIMLTARGDAVDRILGLEMGADDYLAKPFEPRELFARIRSVLRRTHALPPNLVSSEAKFMVFGEWTLDATACFRSFQGIELRAGEDTTMGRPMELAMDMVVLSVGMEPSAGTREVSKLLKIRPNRFGFIDAVSGPLDPVSTSREGIYACGASLGPADLEDTVSSAANAAMKAVAFVRARAAATAATVTAATVTAAGTG